MENIVGNIFLHLKKTMLRVIFVERVRGGLEEESQISLIKQNHVCGETRKRVSKNKTTEGVDYEEKLF